MAQADQSVKLKVALASNDAIKDNLWSLIFTIKDEIGLAMILLSDIENICADNEIFAGINTRAYYSVKNLHSAVNHCLEIDHKISDIKAAQEAITE